jgi:proteasome accessory factor C
MSPRSVADAASQLQRLMHAIPVLRDEEPHKLSELAELLGVSEQLIARDLRTLVTRQEDEFLPDAFNEGVQLAFGGDAVQLRSKLFRRPMGLTPSELAALELGLTALEHEAAPPEREAVRQARALIVKAAPWREVVDGVPEAHAMTPARDIGDALTVLRDAIHRERKARIEYRSANATTPTSRSVHPYGLISVKGRWYLVALCDIANAIRIFRLDRVEQATALEEAAIIPDRLKIEEQLQHGRAMVNHADDHLKVRFSARIARWIVEHEEGEEQPDGSVVVTYPLLDDDWAVRHVLGYGPDAEVVEPERVRGLVRERLEGLLGGEAR